MHENYETDFQKFYKIYPRADENISFLILSPFCTSPKRMWRSGLVPQKNYSSCLFLTKPYRLGVLVGFRLPDWYSYMKSRGCISWGTSPEKGVSVTMQEAFTKLNIFVSKWFWIMTFGDTNMFEVYAFCIYNQLYMKCHVYSTSDPLYMVRRTFLFHVSGCQIATIC